MGCGSSFLAVSHCFSLAKTSKITLKTNNWRKNAQGLLDKWPVAKKTLKKVKKALDGAS